MTGEEQSILNALVAAKQNGGLIGWIAAVVLTLLGWLGTRLWSGLGHRIASAQTAAAAAAHTATKADQNRREDVNAIHAKLDGHIERDELMHNAVMSGLREMTGKLGDIHTALTRELGERPSRAEVREMMRERNQ